MGKSYTRRTDEQQIADFQAKIDAVKARAQRKEAEAGVKGSPDGVAFLAGVKAIDRAMRIAGERKNEPMTRALETARATMGEHLVAMGMRVPEFRPRKPRKAKASKAKAGAA